jgi:hypothetical protein
MQLFQSGILKVFSSVFGRLQSIPHDDPGLTPERWCQAQPCRRIRIASRVMTISQPLSSLWVYFLGFFTIGASLYFFQIQNGDNSRLWWGISLLLWGIGALLAGTSYQAFGYQIKCAGRPVCRWTSWWEVVYLMFQQVSVNAMLVAVAYSCTAGTFQAVLLGYAWLSSLVYVILVFVGAIVPVKSLITFELMIWVSAPVLFFFFFLNGWRYFIFGNPMDLVLLGSWFMLVGTLAAYWIYGKQGIPKKLWARGIWFSENDVLHVLLIFWVVYTVAVVANRISDFPAHF